MNKFRFIATIVMTVLIIVALSFGIYVISQKNMGVLNSTAFVCKDDHVFVDVSYSYDGPELSSRFSNNYTGGFTLRKEDDSTLEDDRLNIPEWTLGDTFFTIAERFIKLTFKITNLNDNYGLKVTFANLAYDEDEKFITSYNIVTGENEPFNDETLVKISSGYNKTADLPSIQIEPNQTKKIQIIYELKKLDQEVKFENNISCTFESISDN